MAVTKIKAIRSTLDKAIQYICNPEKTQGMILVDSFGCVPEFAALQMEAMAKQNKRGGCRKAYHLMQSFAPDDDITPEKALEIGRKFADGVTRGKHQYVIAVHTDRDHIHCHIIFNAVDNTKEHKKYRYAGYSERDRIRDISDQLCRDNGLSVLPRWTTKEKRQKPQYNKPWIHKLREAIDRTVLTSETFEDFVTAMEVEEGYTFKDEKRIAFITDGQKKYTRCGTIGDYYTEEMLRDRIANKEKYKDVDLSLRTRYKKKKEPTPENEKRQDNSASQKKTAPGKESRKKSWKGSFKGEIRRIADLSQNDKAQNSPGYRYVAEKNNLNMFVKTMNFMEKYDIETPEKFRAFYESRYGEVTRLNEKIHQIDLSISELSEKRHHIRIYFKYLKFYNTFMKYRNMNYYNEHQEEIKKFKMSKLWLERSGINPRKYKSQEYQDEYIRLRNEKDALKDKLQPAKEKLYTARNVMQNIESILGIKFYEDEEKGTTSERTARENVQPQDDREQQKKVTDISK